MSQFYFLHWDYIYLLFSSFIFVITIFYKRKQLPITSLISLISFKIIILLCIVVALMTPASRKLSSTKKPHYIFAIDTSKSIERSALQIQLQRYFKEMQSAKYTKFKVSYFVMSDTPNLQALSSFDSEEILSAPPLKYTSIYNSIREIKEGLLEEETPVFFILSDGNETQVQEHVLGTLALEDVYFTPISSISREDNVKIKGVRFPPEVMPNTTTKIKVYIESKKEGQAEVLLSKEAKIIQKKKIDLSIGANVVGFDQSIKKSGIDNYFVQIKPSFEDKKQSNNQKHFHIKIEKPNKYLLVEKYKSQLQNLLSDLKISYIWKKPRELANLNPSHYQAVLINDIAKSDIPDLFESNLMDAVSNGVGLGLFGGMNSYGLGKYYGSDLERIAPVYMPPRSYRKTTLMSFIIDASGSMLTSKKALWGSNNLLAQFLLKAKDSQIPIRVAKKAAIGAVEKLKGMDVSVYSFNDQYRLIVPVTTIDDFNLNSVLQSISSINAGGGTKFTPVLNEAMSAVDLSQHKQSYFFFLSDGVPSDLSMIPSTIDLLIQKKIKLYTIGFGLGVDEFLLKEMASKTGGSYFKADGLNNLESIFEKAMDKVFSHPVVLNEVPIEFDKRQKFFDKTKIKLVSLNGMNMTRAKRGAKTLIRSKGGLPILVQSQYGLGKTFAWMGDSGEKWSQKLIKLGSYKELIGPNLLLISKSNEIHFQLNHQHSGKESKFVARIFDEKGVFLKNLELSAKLTSDKTGKSQFLTFHESEPGVYRASVLGEDGNSQTIYLDYKHKGKTYSLQRNIVIPTNFETAFEGENSLLIEKFKNQNKLLTNESELHKAFSRFKVESKYFVTKHSIPFVLLAIFFYILDVIFRRFRVMDQLQQDNEGDNRWLSLANHYLLVARTQIKNEEQGKAEHSYLSAQKYFKMANENKRAEDAWKEYRIKIR
ncbi:MAG: VWA domain-containing protein [Candidatus Cloacimonetes bacterium]|nr:VWA domain-containing protein [Candidatus Cloacimonadota bacterium]